MKIKTKLISLKHHGFTLIELIIVIVILGILSVVAAPRFIDMGTSARIVIVETMSASLKSAVILAHAKYLVSGHSGVRNVMLDINGTDIQIWYGYPAIANNMETGVGGNDISLLLVNPEDFTMLREDTDGGSWIDFKAKGSQFPDECKVRYWEASSSREYKLDVYITGC